MSEPATWTDGNGAAGVLRAVFGAELTNEPRGCHSCGATNPVGAHRLFHGAGIVLRCPGCGDVAARIVQLPDRYVVTLAGTWRLQLAAG